MGDEREEGRVGGVWEVRGLREEWGIGKRDGGLGDERVDRMLVAVIEKRRRRY